MPPEVIPQPGYGISAITRGFKKKELGMATRQLNTTELWQIVFTWALCKCPQSSCYAAIANFAGAQTENTWLGCCAGSLSQEAQHLLLYPSLCFLCVHEYQVAVQCPSFIISYGTFQYCLHPQIHVLHSTTISLSVCFLWS